MDTLQMWYASVDNDKIVKLGQQYSIEGADEALRKQRLDDRFTWIFSKDSLRRFRDRINRALES